MFLVLKAIELLLICFLALFYGLPFLISITPRCYECWKVFLPYLFSTEIEDIDEDELDDYSCQLRNILSRGGEDDDD